MTPAGSNINSNKYQQQSPDPSGVECTMFLLSNNHHPFVAAPKMSLSQKDDEKIIDTIALLSAILAGIIVNAPPLAACLGKYLLRFLFYKNNSPQQCRQWRLL